VPTFGFDATDAARVRDAVLVTEGLAGAGEPELLPREGEPIVQGFLNDALAAATDSASGQTTATLSVWGGTPLADTGRDVAVVNRQTDLSGDAGCWAVARRVNGTWLVLVVDCEETLTSGGGCPAGTVSVDLVTDVLCVSGSLQVCTTTVCLPAGTILTASDCGGGAGGGTVPGPGPCCDLPETLTATVDLSTCTCPDPTLSITWNGSVWTGTAALPAPCDAETVTVTFWSEEFDADTCVYHADVLFSCSGGTRSAQLSATDQQCTPFSINLPGFEDRPIDGCCNNGNLSSVTIAEP